MDFNSDFLTEILSKEETTVEEKVQFILSEHEASIIGLKDKNYELIGSEKKLKEKLEAYKDSEKVLKERTVELEEELKKASPEEHRKYYDNIIASKEKEFSEKYEKLESERDFYKTSHLKRLKSEAIEMGIKDMQFVNDFRKKSFINNVLMDNDFEAKDIDGEIVFINKDNVTLQDCLKNYAGTAEGKDCLKLLSSGGGSTGSVKASSGKNPFDRNSKDFNLTEQFKIMKENPALATRLKAEAGL